MATRAQVQIKGAAAVPADVTTKAFMIADLDTGQVLAARDPHGRYYPASTLKTLLFDTLYPRLDPGRVVTANEEDVSIEGSAAGIVAGGRYLVYQLWLALILQSDNQAANALARTAGGVPKTLELMNAKAKELHAYDTVAGSPSGLDVAGQTSSAYDLCLFMREIVKTPGELKIAQQMTGALPAVPPKYGPVQFSNQNKLMQNYDGAIAGKTGFTDAARHTFVAAAEKGKRRLVVSLMDGEQTPVPMWEQAAHLLDWGFATDSDAAGVGTLIKPGDYVPALPVAQTSSPSTTPAQPAAQSVNAAPTATHSRLPIWPIVAGIVIVGAAGAVGGLRLAKGKRH